MSHYSKSQIFVQKFNFDKASTFSRVFTQFFFRQFFSWNQSCQQLKSPKPQQLHEFFTQKNRQFSREIKVEFLNKKWRFRTVWQCDWPWDADKVGWIFAILFNWFTRVWRSHDQSKSYFCSDNRFAKTQPAEPAPTMMWLYSDMLWAEVEKARLWELDVGGINALWWCSKDLWAIFEMPLDVTWKKRQQKSVFLVHYYVKRSFTW